MINEVFLIYLLTRLDHVLNFSHFVMVMTIISYFVVGLLMLFSLDAYDAESERKSNKLIATCWEYIKKTMYIPIIAIVINLTVPTKEDAQFIIAGTGLLEIVKSEQAQSIGSKSVQVVEKYLDEMLKEDKK